MASTHEKRKNRGIAQRAVIPRLVLAGLSCLPAALDAQAATVYGIVFPSVGLAHGQRLRLTLFNPPGTPLRARAQVHHSGGLLVALGDGSVRSNAFESFDFDRDDMLSQGEAGTGRLQLRASIEIGVAAAAKKIAGVALAVAMIMFSTA